MRTKRDDVPEAGNAMVEVSRDALPATRRVEAHLWGRASVVVSTCM